MNEEEIKHLAKLARLNLDEEEIEKFTSDMADIIRFANQIDEVDTEGVDISSTSLDMYNVFRDDILKESTDRNKLMQNCKDVEDGMFKIPKTV